MRRSTRFLFSAFSVIVMLSGVAGQATADVITPPVACTQPTAGGYSTYVDCGSYVDTVAGNSSDPFSILGTSYAQLNKWSAGSGSWSVVENNWAVTGTPGSWGTWATPYNILFVLIETADNLSVYGQGPCNGTGFAYASQGDGSLTGNGSCTSGANSGFWATAPTLLDGNDLPNGLPVSHISFYGIAPTCDPEQQKCGNPISVPEPGVLSLIGLGLLGLGLTRRRIKNQVE